MMSKKDKQMILLATYLLPLTTTHVRWLSALVVDVGPEVLHQWLGRGLRLLDSSVNRSFRLLVDFLQAMRSQSPLRRARWSGTAYLKVLLSTKTPLLDVALETVYRVLGRPHALHLLTRTVSGTGIRHPKHQIGM